MLTKISKIKLLFAFGVAFAGILAGCTAPLSTRPNDPYQGSIPGSFHILEKKNLLLATELAKLPEIHDGISDSEKMALEKMGQLYMSDPDSFNAAFKEMYRIGKPGVRKYCSPLQALFWMAEDGNLTAQNNPLVNYSLKKILITAWQINYCNPDLTDEQVIEVIEGIEDQALRNQFRQYLEDGVDKAIADTIFGDYEKNPKTFSQPAQKIILKALRTRKTLDPRWNDFETVVERLNAPELIDYYQNRNFRYLRYASSSKNGGPSSAPDKIFIRKAGNCSAYTAFTIHCLNKAGYKAWPERPEDKNHITTFFKSEGVIYILDNAWRFHQFTGLSGPYSDRQSALNAFKKK